MFQQEGSPNFPKLEAGILALWRERGIYEKSLARRAGAPRFVFYEGPPTANGMPHPGHCLTRAIKDLFPRYRTMRGYLCERKGGWDTHGLPVEVEVCKELGIHSKEEIEAFGVEPFIKKCQASVWRYMREWERLTERLGFWIHLDEAYVTYHQSYVESVWWALKRLFDEGLLYQGHKIVWWWAQGGTALSSGEVGLGYREVADPSVYVRFPLLDQQGQATGTDLLVWTTTPWTLPSNQFAAVHPELEYSLVEDQLDDGTARKYWVASALVETLATKFNRTLSVTKTAPGSSLLGTRYVPPFDYYYRTLGSSTSSLRQGGREHLAWRVVAADFVTTDSGTGVVHQAPAFGEVDFEVLVRQQERFVEGAGPELINAVGPDGKFTAEAPDYQGRWVKDCDRDITRELRARGLLLHQEQYLHEYPFCWRADNDPLIQYPRRSWFIRTRQFREAMLANNRRINWMPEHIRDGRFGNFLESNVDWALSRERYWGTPLPIWQCAETGRLEAVASYEELLKKPGVAGTEVWERAKAAEPELCDDLKVHKPYIDALTYDSPFAAGARMRRVTEVIDCWFDSGAMPFAQWGYPHQNQDKFRDQFPADFISEALDQTRGWFYSLLAISTLLFGEKNETSPLPPGEGGQRPGEGGEDTAIHNPLTPALSQRERGQAAASPLPLGEGGQRPGEGGEDTAIHNPLTPALSQRERGQAAASPLPLGEGGQRPGEGGEDTAIHNPLTPALSGHQPARLVVERGENGAEYPHPYRNCIVLGLMLGEDGQKMSKQKRNYREPSEIFDRYGADALRWYFFANQAPWTSIRYSEQSIKDSVPEFLLRLWNVYSFFVIYANIDRFDPAARLSGNAGQLDAASLARADGYRPVSERSELDRWILSELSRTTSAVVERMDAYDNFAAAARITAFVDALSNWYVRRSRDRFWSGEASADKLDAYWTLYEALLTTAKLVAPFVPFVAEAMWQNLARAPFGERTEESVHLCDYPAADSGVSGAGVVGAGVIDDALSSRMAAVRDLVSLGRAARMESRLKVRQPLAKVEIILADRVHQDWLAEHAALICEELNVKQVEFTAEAEKYVSFAVLPDLKRLGPRLGKSLPEFRKVLAAQQPALLLRQLESAGQASLTVAGQTITLAREDLQIRLQALPGWAAAQGASGVVVLSTELSPELLAEGIAREVVHAVQGLRKDASLEYTDRIELVIESDDAEIMAAVSQFAEYLRGETLAVTLHTRAIPGIELAEYKIGAAAVRVGIRKV